MDSVAGQDKDIHNIQTLIKFTFYCTDFFP